MRLAGGAVGVRKPLFGRGARVGGLAARGLRRLDLIEQGAAQAQKFRRRIGELVLLGLGLGETRLNFADLRRCAFAPRRPRAALAFDGIAALRARLAFMEMGLQARTRFGRGGAILRCGGTRGIELLRQLGEIGQARKIDRCFGALVAQLVACAEKPVLGLVERRKTGGELRLLAFGLRQFFARGFERAHGFAMRVMGFALGRRLVFQLGADLVGLGLQRIGARARGGGFDQKIAKPVFLGEPTRGRRRRIVGLRKAVPAPEIAFARDEALAGLQPRAERGAFALGDDADLRKPARERRRRGDIARERFDAVGERRIALGADQRPMRGRRGINRRFEIIAERGAKRRLIAFGDGDLFEHRRPFAVGRHGQEFRDGRSFGLKTMRFAFRLLQGRANARFRLALRVMGRFRRGDTLFRGLSGGKRGIQRFLESRLGIGRLKFGLQAREIVAKLREFRLEAGETLRVFFQAFLQARALRLAVRDGGLRLRKRVVGNGERRFRRRERVPRERFRLRIIVAHGGEIGGFRVELVEDGGRIFDQGLFAGEIGIELREPAFEFGHARLGAPFFAVERFARENELLQFARGLLLGFAQRRQLMRGDSLQARGFRLFPCLFGKRKEIDFELAFGGDQRRARIHDG